ncbi:hypothetical protein H0E87_030101 [Populus deltoides]|uniref:Uncharacterized protein n=1 Tax=Populus deltoides TaxID=3696 RepID=A0A8T2WNJ0_POPDE|nr:hypothetical protein H0E87_030101 [Populus deltoides]
MDNNMSCIRRAGVGVVVVPHGTSSRSLRMVRGVVVVSHVSSSGSSRRGCGVVRASMVDSYESSSDFVKRMEQAWLISQFCLSNVSGAYSNQGQLRVLLAIQRGKLNANGVRAQDSSFLAITCSAKFLPEIPLVLFVLERGQCAALIVKELAFEPGGWGSLPSPSSSTVIQLSGS